MVQIAIARKSRIRREKKNTWKTGGKWKNRIYKVISGNTIWIARYIQIGIDMVHAIL